MIAWLGVKFGINFTRCSENGSKLHSASPRAILLPFSLQLMKFIPNFTPSHAITYTNITLVTRHIYTIAYHRKKNTETPVKILILKQIYTETSELSLEALYCTDYGGCPDIVYSWLFLRACIFHEFPSKQRVLHSFEDLSVFTLAPLSPAPLVQSLKNIKKLIQK